MPKRTRAEKRARTAVAREAKRLKTTSGESGGSSTYDDDPLVGDGLLAEEEITQEVGGGEGGSEPPPSLPLGGCEAVPPYPSGTPGAEGLLERDLTCVMAALREALAADGLLGEVKDEVARVDEALAREASMGALSVLEA
ncbi:hypothetical protein COL516b_012591 [Colletotrichum fioriniae]|nr:uncharacterized protein COL516b_012591 [Colletotrichum fioriniae]KAJ0295399.1 hypothetical protein COL516b_012591 [Colletotrichum fioriniae]